MAPAYDQNGESATNGTNGHGKQELSATSPKESSKRSQAAVPKGSGGSLLSNIMSLRKASKRPLPTDRGDGTYREIVRRPGISQDLRSLSMKSKIEEFSVINLFL
jgi:hypothetical protein